MTLVDAALQPDSIRLTRRGTPGRDNIATDTIGGGLTIERVGASDWDRLASTFVDVNQEQTHCFWAARYQAGRIEPTVVLNGDDILGGAVVVVVAIPGTARRIALVKWGPLWRRQGMPADPARLQAVLVGLTGEYVHQRGHFLSIHPHADDPAFENLACRMLEGLGFKAGASANDPDRYLVNVGIPPEQLRRSLDQKWRYNLKKAEAKGLRIAFVSREEGLAPFMDLYRQMLARKRFADWSAISTLPALMGSEVAAFRPKLAIASHEGTPTAGAVIDVSGERAVYLYGATDERALGLKAGYALQWWIAENLCRTPLVRWYDLGGKDGDKGLHQFKKGFVGKEGLIMPTPPSFQLAASWTTRSLGHAAFAMRKATGRLHNAMHRASVRLCL